MSDPKHLRKYPDDVLRLYKQEFAAELRTREAESCLCASEYNALQDLQNFVSHRGTLPRQFNVGDSLSPPVTMPGNIQDLPVLLSYGQPGDATTLIPLASWLSSCMVLFVRAAAAFGTTHL